MSAATKLGVYGLVLAAALGGGAAVGAVAGPIAIGGTDHGTEHVAAPVRSGEPADPHAGHADGAIATALPAGGLLVTQDGYTLRPEDRRADAGEFAFTIVGPDGLPVQDFDAVHDRELHLIVASRDLRRYLHVHPERDDAGRWTVDLPKLAPGVHRAFADFRPTGAAQYTLGVDLFAPGAATAFAPLAARTVHSVDGYEVTLDYDPAGTEATVTVRRDGEVVTTEPYLGAAGHLVALRDGDLGYLHVHPIGEVPVGPVRFTFEPPGPGAYALFFDFQVDGVVRTARFVVDVATHVHPSGTHTHPGTAGDHGH